MNILCITQNFPPTIGGISVFLHNLCAQLSHLKHHVDVLAPAAQGCPDVDKAQPYRVYRYVSRQRLSSIVPIHWVLTLYRQRRYDVIFIGHFMTTHALGVLLLRKFWNIPFVVLCHGNDLHYSISNGIDRVVSYYLLAKASMILSNSHATAERVKKRGYRGPVEILHPGVDPHEFRPGLDTSPVRQRYNINGRKVLLSVSRLAKRKGHDRVLHALPDVIQKVPTVLYVIVGSGEEEPRLRKIVEEMGLEAHVVFAGYVDQILLPSLYSASDLLVMTSFERDGGNDYEGFGIVFTEANACGKPVIGARSGGMAEAVIDGKTGLLVDPYNKDEIAEAIIRILTNRQLAQSMGENGRRRVEWEFSWERVGQLADQFLRTVIQGTG